MSSFVPARYRSRPSLPITTGPVEAGEEFDALIVGAGPAGLAAAIKLAQLAKEKQLGDLRIAVVEKAAAVGNHTLSGSVINPFALRQLFPSVPEEELPFARRVTRDRLYLLTGRRAHRLPMPPTMQNEGHYVASLGDVVRWLAARAEELGVMVFPGFPAASLLTEGNRVLGVRTAERDRGRDGAKLANYQPATDLTARVTVLAEGVRGRLGTAYLSWQGVASRNPQTYATGVKEVWEVPAAPQAVVHTMGWPLEDGIFGGSFMYPLADNLVSLGLVVGLDHRAPDLDPHFLMQKMKTHPLFKRVLEGGTRVEWGAKAIPEGGYYSLPSRLSGDGVLVLGDTAGLVNVPALKGVHYAMYSGLLAAQAMAQAFKEQNFSAARLGDYDRSLRESFVLRDLRRVRNMRQAFHGGLYQGLAKAGLMYLTRGWWPRVLSLPPDASVERRDGRIAYPKPDGKLTFTKVDSVGLTNNTTRSDMPSHLALASDVPPEVARFYSYVCPAGVYEVTPDGKLQINPSNCIDCMTTDVLLAPWSPREGGSGARYRRM